MLFVTSPLLSSLMFIYRLVFDYILKILYHLEANYYKWTEVSSFSGLDSAKSTVTKHVRQHTGLVIDTPTSAGGNTNSGPTAESFFEPKNREKICSVLKKTEDREKFSKLMSRFYIVFRIVHQVHHYVDHQKLRELSYDLMLFIKTEFPWVSIIESAHVLLAHYWELFQLLDGLPIFVYSEQGSESWNKYI